MPGKSSNLGQFWQELKRRKVIKVIAMYAATAFIIMEAGDIMLPRLGLPDWTVTFIIILLIVGFPISVILSWIFDVTLEGLKKTEPVKVALEKGAEAKPAKRKLKVSDVIIAVLVVVVCILLYPKIFEKEKVIELEKSIAVLPFENMSDDSQFAHLGDALTDEIIMQLFKINEFEVRSRTSIMQYKDTEKGSPLIGEELKVNYLLEGSTQRYEDQVRIRIQLIHASTDDHIWGDIFEGEWKDIFDIQINVAKQVAHELKTVLTPEEKEQIDKQPTDNLEAYDLYLKGRYFWNKRTKKGINEAIEYFSDAIEKDTNYALAYAGLADAYILLALYGWYLPQQEAYLKGKEIALEALKIDTTLAEAYASIAFVKIWHEWDWNGALKDFKRAIQLNPDYGTAHQWYASCLVVLRQHDEAIAEGKRAQELDPFSPIINRDVASLFYYAHKYDQAIEESLKALNITPDFPLTHQILGLSYLQKGMFSEAIFEMQKAVKYSGDDLNMKAYLGYAYGATGNQAEAEVILNGLIEKSIEEYVHSIAIARIYIGLGDNDNAISWLEKAYEEHSYELTFLNTEPIYDPLRSDPRFIELVKKMNFE